MIVLFFAILILPYYLLTGLAVYESYPKSSIIHTKYSTIDSVFIITAWPLLPFVNFLLTGRWF